MILLCFCGVALSETDILLDGLRNAYFSISGRAGYGAGGWFGYGKNRYAVCDSFARTKEPTNWLRTDFIDVKDAIRVDIIVNYTVRKCRPGQTYCKEYFKLYGYQTLKTSPRPNPLVTPFDFLAKAKPTNVPDRPTRPGDFNLLKVSIKIKRKGLYLAFYDQGSCLSLLSVRVSFNYCPEIQKRLVTFARTASPFSDSSADQVEGRCTDQQSRNTTVLTATCTSQGNWMINDNVRCLCQPGYRYSSYPKPRCC
ncbi:ephrin type-B receptor 1-A-like [Actinia tenebrosa]|uniref:Ephrin type-B receptor 1-A-like n=1 Tax=Actinia tenebrosa TaxID=6105 RepID=A0A6P8IJI6_ACTTE|nr:ephrin type-B receptor 1-A-like [Actinia tenebrosa]